MWARVVLLGILATAVPLFSSPKAGAAERREAAALHRPAEPEGQPEKERGAAGPHAALPAGELRLLLSLARRERPGSPELEVSLRNVGERDLTLNLGTMLANGKRQLPDRIRLRLTDARGTEHELRYLDRRVAGAAGRVDDYVVPLRAGSTYTLRLRLEEFWSPGMSLPLRLPPGHYRASARYEGSAARTGNADTQGVALLNFWLGKVESEAVALRI